MCVFLILLLYWIPLILLLDLIHVTYKQATENGSAVYVWEIITYIALSICPLINLALVIIYLRYLRILFNEYDDIHDDILEGFRKYSVFKFLLNRIN